MASHEQTVLDNLHLSEDIIHHLITVPTENANSFTALLELPPNQAVELLQSPNSSLKTRPVTGPINPPPPPHYNASNLTFPTNAALIERAARFSVFAGENWNTATSPETTPLNSSEKSVKIEPAEVESCQNQTPVVVSDQHPATEETGRPVKRKGRENKGKGPSKKSKSCGNDKCEDAEKLPYVHVRARRGQATDRHSLAERARREKINARMKLLQELVPGCNKISGTALVLDEIINHVQSLQRQVEFLSMRLAAVNLKIDFDLDSVLATEGGPLMDSDFSSMVMPLAWPEVQVNGNRQHYQQQEWHCDAAQQQVWGREVGNYNCITLENSHLSYNSPANSASLHSNQLKMEL